MSFLGFLELKERLLADQMSNQFLNDSDGLKTVPDGLRFPELSRKYGYIAREGYLHRGFIYMILIGEGKNK